LETQTQASEAHGEDESTGHNRSLNSGRISDIDIDGNLSDRDSNYRGIYDLHEETETAES